MNDTQQPQPDGTETTRDEAAAALAEIQLRQQQVIKAALVPVWYWWVMAAGIIAIGAARDTHDLLVQAITYPLAVLVMAGLTGAMIPELRRRVQVYGAIRPGARGAAGIFGLIVLVIAVTIATAASLRANGVTHPMILGYGAGAAVLVIAGPVVNGYLRRLMLSQSRQHTIDAPEAGGTR